MSIRIERLGLAILMAIMIAAAPMVADALVTNRDDKGVWFITGSPDESVYDIFEAMGYAVATDRLSQTEKLRRLAGGRLAEFFGPDYLGSDIFNRTTGYSADELQAGFDALSDDARAMISGYVAGFNRRIAEVRADVSLLPFEFRALGILPEDWTASDVLACVVALLRSFDPEAYDFAQTDNVGLAGALYSAYGATVQAAMFQDLRWTNDPDAQTYFGSPSTTAAAASRSNTAPSSITQSDSSSFSDISAAFVSMRDRLEAIDENLEKINARIKMGSYAWVVDGSKTQSGRPILYSGPQMGFSVPAIVNEGSIEAGDLHISGMNVAGIPGIIIGRTPHHAWSMQVGHAHTTDYYVESAGAPVLHRTETIKVAGQADVTLPVYRTNHGPVINPMPFDPSTTDPIISWKYSHWGYEFASLDAYLMLARATSMDEFGAAIEKIAVSQHFCYADRDGNIAYWMSGRDPVRAAGEWRFPQGIPIVTDPPKEWDAAVLIPRSHDRNPDRGFYGGWNNKTRPEYDNAYNSVNDIYGPFQRAHVIYDYLENNDNLTYADVRDLALSIATTDSFNGGGNPWPFVKADFEAAVDGEPTADRQAAIDLLNAWDGHFVAGGPSQWVAGMDRADAWMLLDRWLAECLKLTFQDEFSVAGLDYRGQNQNLLFNVFLHGLPGAGTTIVNNYDWFAPSTSTAIIRDALDEALSELGDQPWGIDQRGEIAYVHELIDEIHTTPYASRSTYAHCVELDTAGPMRIESMFPLGQSGTILMNESGGPVYDPNFFSMAPVFDAFAPRPFALLAATEMPADENGDGDLDGSDLAVYAVSFGSPDSAPLYRVAGWYGQLQPE